MDGAHTVQQMVEQALRSIEQCDRYLAWIDQGNMIQMHDKTAERGTHEWKLQLERNRKMDADFVNAIISDPTYSVRISKELFPEFGNI